MPKLSLYNLCLRRMPLFLKDGIWKSVPVNPFCFLPPNVIKDLVSSTVLLQQHDGFRATDLELLLSSGLLREFKIHAMRVKTELAPALKTLALGCQNLEVLSLTELTFLENSDDVSEALQDLIRKCPNLKVIHSSVKFDLKSLRNCKKLQKIMLHFRPKQPWFDFLEEKQGCLQSLDSLELFTICDLYPSEPHSIIDSYIATLLRNCPALTSLGLLDTSGALAQLRQTAIVPQVKLRCCFWGDNNIPDFEPYFNFNYADQIQDAVAYHPFVEDLHFNVLSILSVAHLSSLKNLVFLDIRTKIKGNFNLLFCNVIEDIGFHLKYLSFDVKSPIDISTLLPNCPNLVALKIWDVKSSEFKNHTVSLPYLEHFTLLPHGHEDEQRILPLISNCHNLRELFMINTSSFDDKTLDKFLWRNSLSNLKIAYFERCGWGLTKQGFQKLLLNAPELEKIEVVAYLGNEKLELEMRLKRALLQTNHKALFNKNLVSRKDEFFFKKRLCNFI